MNASSVGGVFVFLIVTVLQPEWACRRPSRMGKRPGKRSSDSEKAKRSSRVDRVLERMDEADLDELRARLMSQWMEKPFRSMTCWRNAIDVNHKIIRMRCGMGEMIALRSRFLPVRRNHYGEIDCDCGGENFAVRRRSGCLTAGDPYTVFVLFIAARTKVKGAMFLPPCLIVVVPKAQGSSATSRQSL